MIAREALASPSGRVRAVPPSPKGHPLFGILPRWIKDPARFCADTMVRYDDLVRLDFGVKSIYMVTLPEHVRQVLVERHGDYWKGRLFQRASFLFGNGLVLNEGDSWRRQRRLMQPAFSHRRLERWLGIMAEVVSQKLDHWEAKRAAGEPVEMNQEMMSLTLRIIAKSMFSLSVDDAELDRLARAFNTVLHHMTLRMFTYFLPEAVPLPGQRACREAMAVLEGMVFRIVRERREKGDEGYDDLLSMLLSARDAETGEGMSDREVRDEILTILFGGYEATADGLAWTWHLLAQHPEVEERFRQEVFTALPEKGAPSFEDFAQLRWTAQIAQESMRLFPPFWFYSRTTRVETEIGAYTVPADAMILLCPFATHRHPAHWDDPETFDPGRFAPERFDEKMRAAYFPFGLGQRTCIGRHFALHEMQLILTMVARSFRLRPVPDRPVKPVAGVSIRARHGIWMSLEKA